MDFYDVIRSTASGRARLAQIQKPFDTAAAVADTSPRRPAPPADTIAATDQAGSLQSVAAVENLNESRKPSARLPALRPEA